MQVDPKISIAVAIALLAQSAAGFIWAGRVTARLDQIERALAASEPTGERLARLEAQLADLRVSMARVERSVEHRR
jgi:hypothetical protein